MRLRYSDAHMESHVKGLLPDQINDVWKRYFYKLWSAMRMMVILMMNIVFSQSYQQDQRYKRSSVLELNSSGGYYNPEKVNLLQWGYFLCLCEIERIEIYRQFDVFRRYSSKVKASRNQASGQKSSLITPQYLDWAQHESWNTSLKLLPVL